MKSAAYKKGLFLVSTPAALPPSLRAMEIFIQCCVVGSIITYLILQILRWIRADSDLTVQWAEWWGKSPGKSPAEFLLLSLSLCRGGAQLFPFNLLGVCCFLPRGDVAQVLRGCARPLDYNSWQKG